MACPLSAEPTLDPAWEGGGGHEPAAVPSSGSLLEMQSLGPTPRPLDSNLQLQRVPPLPQVTAAVYSRV